MGGAGLVFVEASGVEARGRISPQDLGIYKDEHVEGLSKVVQIIKSNGAVPGIQIAHAGRKASVTRPWDGDSSLKEGEAWETLAPSPISFGGSITHTPKEATKEDIQQVIQAFKAAAGRALKAGFQFLEIHGAHGYLIHEFYSPITNKRTDEYGGSFENRIRLLLEVTKAVREIWPQNLPLSVRLSTTDWEEGGWTVDNSVELSKKLKELGVDIIDCSSGFINPNYRVIPFGPGYQVPASEAIRKGSNIATAAVGGITDPAQADEIIRNNRADLVLIARQSLRDPYFPYHAAVSLKHPNPHLVLPTQNGFFLSRG